MAESPKRAGPTALTASAAAIYTAGGAGTWSILRSLFVVCTDVAAVNVTVGVYTSASDAAARRVLDAVTVSPGQPLDLPGLFIPLLGHASTPDLVYALADRASAGNIVLGLVEGP